MSTWIFSVMLMFAPLMFSPFESNFFGEGLCDLTENFLTSSEDLSYFPEKNEGNANLWNTFYESERTFPRILRIVLFKVGRKWPNNRRQPMLTIRFCYANIGSWKAIHTSCAASETFFLMHTHQLHTGNDRSSPDVLFKVDHLRVSRENHIKCCCAVSPHEKESQNSHNLWFALGWFLFRGQSCAKT